MADMSVPTAAAEHRQPQRKTRRRRRRLVVSCTECHRRKQKCDRSLPCANCVSRNKASSCEYETVPKADSRRRRYSKSRTPSSASDYEHEPSPRDPAAGSGRLMSSVKAVLGYSGEAEVASSTIGLLQRIGSQDGDADRGGGPGAGSDAFLRNGLGVGLEHGNSSLLVRENFKSLIRQLPSRTFLNRLIAIFLDKFNYQYYAVEPDVLSAQLDRWDALPFRLLTRSGPDALPPDMRAFPAVLFQIAATALHIVGDKGDAAAELAPLKYTASMSFDDLALDYSESGVSIIGLFGKRDMTYTTIQAEFLRAAFLKSMACVGDSWHAISITIKDAQELGIHSDELDPKPVDDSPESVLENQWLIQSRRKLYMVLTLWDTHMCVLLDRPGTIDCRQLPSIPIDSIPPTDRSRDPIVPRDENRDPPSPLTGMLWMNELTKGMALVRDLERERPRRHDRSRIDAVHRAIVDTEARKPAIFRVDDPDTRWDTLREAHWVPIVRYQYAGLSALNLMVLHRPYIFHSEIDRREALKASIQVLDMGRLMFQGIPPDYWGNYHLFYGNFDAIVTVSIIYIIFPHENSDLRTLALQQFHWSMERFSAMQDYNALAKAAQGIIHVVHSKLTKAVEARGGETPGLDTPPTLSRGGTGTTSTTPASSSRDAAGRGEHVPDPKAVDAAGPPGAATAQAAEGTAAGDWMSAPMPDLTTLAPVTPIYDLLFNDLNVVGDGMLPMATTTALPAPAQHQQQQPLAGDGVGVADPWQFGGGFGEDTVWQFLNQYQPGDFWMGR